MEGSVENTRQLKGRISAISIVNGTLYKEGYAANTKIRQYKEQHDEVSRDLTQ